MLLLPPVLVFVSAAALTSALTASTEKHHGTSMLRAGRGATAARSKFDSEAHMWATMSAARKESVSVCWDPESDHGIAWGTTHDPNKEYWEEYTYDTCCWEGETKSGDQVGVWEGKGKGATRCWGEGEGKSGKIMYSFKLCCKPANNNNAPSTADASGGLPEGLPQFEVEISDEMAAMNKQCGKKKCPREKMCCNGKDGIPSCLRLKNFDTTDAVHTRSGKDGWWNPGKSHAYEPICGPLPPGSSFGGPISGKPVSEKDDISLEEFVEKIKNTPISIGRLGTCRLGDKTEDGCFLKLADAIISMITNYRGPDARRADPPIRNREELTSGAHLFGSKMYQLVISKWKDMNDGTEEMENIRDAREDHPDRVKLWLKECGLHPKLDSKQYTILGCILKLKMEGKSGPLREKIMAEGSWDRLGSAGGAGCDPTQWDLTQPCSKGPDNGIFINLGYYWINGLQRGYSFDRLHREVTYTLLHEFMHLAANSGFQVTNDTAAGRLEPVDSGAGNPYPVMNMKALTIDEGFNELFTMLAADSIGILDWRGTYATPACHLVLRNYEYSVRVAMATLKIGTGAEVMNIEDLAKGYFDASSNERLTLKAAIEAAWKGEAEDRQMVSPLYNTIDVPNKWCGYLKPPWYDTLTGKFDAFTEDAMSSSPNIVFPSSPANVYHNLWMYAGLKGSPPPDSPHVPFCWTDSTKEKCDARPT
eukprot:g3109.t1